MDVVTLGESLVAIRAHGRLALADPLHASPAGAEMNVAIGLSRLGHRTAWVGVLGADPAGDLVARTLRAESVDLDWVRRDESAPTGLMLVDMPAAIAPTVTYHRRASAGSRIGPADVVALTATTARIWHLSGITPALSETAHAATTTAFEVARETSALVSFDVNYRAKLWDRAAAGAALAPLARRADIVVASEGELDLVADGACEAERVAQLLDAGVSEVVVKRGVHGATMFNADGAVSCPAYAITEVNSIGAGDAFTAGYLSGALDGLSIAQRLYRGARCGALAVSGAGDWEQAPTRADLALLEASPGDAIR
ncbi:MAG TPA: sugar kinase [Microbacterium sp.]|uniref:sugar kinase n=1 Tax=Microbacterium sp. TaxID=51671 RepID=UPI002BD03B97|nr:sugar kinase [Microbacterium sp.]HWI29902.1 sugar kinase [Microbacterium sp.]